MKTNSKVPFYSNTVDNTHCYQSCLKMILKFYFPDKDYTFEALDALTDQTVGLWTWPIRGILNLKKMGFIIEIIDRFDYNRFSNEGVSYLSSEYGQEIADAQELHSDIPKVLKDINLLLSEDISIDPNPSLEGISKLLKKGYLVVCNVNLAALNSKAGYDAHFVLIYQTDDEFVYFHDPGLPPVEARKEKIEFFDRVWETKDAYAFKLPH